MNRKSRKYFFTSMIVSSLFLILIMGFTIVEKNGQSIISGENISLISYTDNNQENRILKIHLLGKDIAFCF